MTKNRLALKLFSFFVVVLFFSYLLGMHYENINFREQGEQDSTVKQPADE